MGFPDLVFHFSRTFHVFKDPYEPNTHIIVKYIHVPSKGGGERKTEGGEGERGGVHYIIEILSKQYF